MLKLDDPDFQEGARLFNEGKYFEAHEAWELLWRRTPAGSEREVYQGLIQLAAACHHLVRGEAAGARGCLENARGHLGGAFMEFAWVVGQAVEQGKPDLLPKFPICGS